MPIEDESFIFARHTKRADGLMGLGAQEKDIASKGYPHVTKEGVEKARITARKEFVPMVEDAVEGSILFIGGSSEEYRTKETAEIVGEELAEHFKNQANIKIVTKAEIEKMRENAKEQKGSVLDDIKELIDKNSDKQIVFTYPLFLKELSLRPHFRDDTGKSTQFSKEIVDKVGTDEKAGVKEWFERAEDSHEVPSPQETAELHLRAVERLRNFAKNFTGNRPLQLGLVAHGWQLDAFALFLANKGKVSPENFQKLFEGQPIDQAETAKVLITGDNIKFIYRDREYEVPKEILNL